MLRGRGSTSLQPSEVALTGGVRQRAAASSGGRAVRPGVQKGTKTHKDQRQLSSPEA
jgi:hypothetical protein